MEIKENHIIIGLGGTGGSIIRSFRKRLFTEYSDEELLKVPIGFLYVDSSKEMMDPNDPTWKVLGKNAQLGRNSQLFIKGASLKTQLNNVEGKKGISSWLGDGKIWDNIIGGTADIAAGGQRRRLGRFLFSCKITEFLSSVATQVTSVRSINSNSSDITFHVFAGLAGGTGSGSIIDVIAQLRKNYQPNISGGINFKIIPYVFIPEQLPKAGWDAGYYHSNGFAALLELNALALHQLKPHDINGHGDRIDISEYGDFFTGCYLYSNINEAGVVMDTKEVLPNLVSDFLFQKINLNKGGNEQNAIERTEGYENILDRKEFEGGIAVRSRNFWSFGIKRIEIPEQEIVEYFTYNFTRQSLMQFKFNNWSDDFGFRDQPRNEDYHSFVNDKQNISNWYLSDEHLTLSKAILKSDESQKWKTIIEDWNAIISSLKTTAWDNAKDKTTPLNQLSKLCEDRYDRNFRRVGVSEFYKLKKQAKRDIAKEIEDIIERDLFQQWNLGQRSISEISKILNLLIDATGMRFQAIATKLNQISEEIEKQIINKQKNEVEWAKTTPLSDLLGKRKKLFEAHGVILQTLYTRKTEQEAWQFARELLAEVLNQLQLFSAQVSSLSDRMNNFIAIFEKLIAARCQDEKLNPDSYKDPVIRYYDSQVVKKFSDRIVRDQDIQKRQTSVVRDKIVKQLGAEPTFTKFNERISDEFLRETLESIAHEQSVAAHDELITNKKEKIIGVNIIEKLYEQYGNDQNSLKDFIRGIVNYSGTLISFKGDEERTIPHSDTIGTNIKVSRLSISIPATKDISPTFIKNLENAFKESTANPNVQFDYNGKSNEIVILSTVCAFPLRFVNDIHYLRQKYDSQLKMENEEISRLVLHIEGDGTQYPPLYSKTDSEKRAESEHKRKFYEGLAYYLIGVGLDSIKMMDLGDGTGKMQYGISKTDRYGREVSPVFFGSKLITAYDKLDENNLSIIIANVTSKINGEFLHITRRGELIHNVVSAINNIKAECNGNVNDKIYKEFLTASDIAINILEN